MGTPDGKGRKKGGCALDELLKQRDAESKAKAAAPGAGDVAELDLDELGRDCCDGLHAGGQGAGSLCKRCKRRAQQSLPDRLCDLASGFECLHAGLFVKLCGDFDPLDCKSLDGYTYDQVLERKYSRYGCKAPPAERPCVADQGVGGVVRPLVLREAWCYDSPCNEPPTEKQRQCK